MIFRQNIHSCTECAKQLSSFSVMTFTYLRCEECEGAWVSHATLHRMFVEMRAGTRVEMKALPVEKKKRAGPSMLAFNVSDGYQLSFIEEPIIKVGRLESCHLRLDHPSVSRVHCVIEFDGFDEIVVIDLGSERGTTVNGKRINKANLRDGDLLQIGNHSVELTVLEKDAREPSASGRACVDCRAPMMRCHLQGVVVDVCEQHGAWFDAKELQLVLHRLTL
jgi:Zn-finger nucleic acid-binding protein